MTFIRFVNFILRVFIEQPYSIKSRHKWFYIQVYWTLWFSEIGTRLY